MNDNNHLKKAVLAIAAATVLMSGCATKNPNDPLENYNRAMFSVNETFDKYAFKPIAQGYDFILPNVVQSGISNFFGNISDVWTAFNNFLQGEGQKGIADVARVTVNTIFGLGGFIDVASELQITKHHADFGQTLGVWGVESGPYVVLPILGPSTVRDTVALPAEWYGDPWTYVDKVRVRNAGIVVRAVNYRASLLDAGSMVEDASLDKYEFVRDAFMQRRHNQIHGVTENEDGSWTEVQGSDPFINSDAELAKDKNEPKSTVSDENVVVPTATQSNAIK